MKFYTFCLLSLFLVNTQALELQDRDAIRNNASKLFVSRQFSQLNELVLTYQETEEKTSNGVWKLRYVYDGISKLTRIKMTTSKRNQLEELALKYIETYPDSSVGYLIYTDMLINHAWMYKEKPYSYYIRYPKKYHPQISKAKDTLNHDIKAFSQDPHWYELMLLIAREEKWSRIEFTRFLNQAIKQFPDYLGIYIAAVGYLLPNPFYHDLEFELEVNRYPENKKNHEEEIDRLALNALNDTNNKFRRGMYARIYWYVLSRSSLNKPLFKKSTVNWKQMKTSFKDIIQQYPVQWNINNFARFACLAGDPVTTFKLINQIKGEANMLAWQEQSFFERCKAWANLMTNEIIKK